MTDKDKVRDTFASKLSAPINFSAVSIIGVYTMLWGWWVGNGFWHAFSRAPLYDALASVAPEWVWGAFALTVGVIMLYGVIKPSYKTLTRGAFAGFLHWFTIGAGYFVGDWQNTGGITAAMVAVYCAFIYLNLRINRGTHEFEKHVHDEKS